MRRLLRDPRAVAPILLAALATGLVVWTVATTGFRHEADESGVARLWQLVMLAQLPLIGWFAIEWLPRAPRQALALLACQVGAFGGSLALLLVLEG